MTDLTRNSTVTVSRAGVPSITLRVDAWSDNLTRPLRRKPGSGPVETQEIGGLWSNAVSFTIDDDADTAPLFFAASGLTFDVVIRVQGEGAGKPERRFSGIGQINAVSPAGTIRNFAVTITSSGAISDSVQ